MERINSVFHRYSSKPFLLTTRDSLIVACFAILIVIAVGFLYYLVTGNLAFMKTGDYWITVARSFFLSLLLGYLYEYSGVNARTAVDSTRYAKGSALAKYQSRNAAHVAEIAADEYRVRLESIAPDAVREYAENYDRLVAMLNATRQIKVVHRTFDESVDDVLDELIAKKYTPTLSRRQVELLRNIVPSQSKEENRNRLRAVPRLLELLGSNDELVRYFIKNGFSAVRLAADNNGLDLPYLAKESGIDIHQGGIGIGREKAKGNVSPSEESL